MIVQEEAIVAVGKLFVYASAKLCGIPGAENVSVCITCVQNAISEDRAFSGY
jgi:hypothetical protein